MPPLYLIAGSITSYMPVWCWLAAAVLFSWLVLHIPTHKSHSFVNQNTLFSQFMYAAHVDYAIIYL